MEYERVTLEEYISAIQKEASKYNIECNVLEYDKTRNITRVMMEKSINDIKIMLDEYENSNKIDVLIHGRQQVYLLKKTNHHWDILLLM